MLKILGSEKCISSFTETISA